MEIRPPDRPLEWPLLPSPATVMLLGTFLGWVIQKPENEEAILLFAIVASCLAAPLCIFAGFLFSKANPRWYMRAGLVLVVTVTVAILNYSIAIAGCALAIR